MSRYVTPFLVINLGAEMVFVVAQRLQAQGVDHERSALVLDEIISVLVSQQLVAEIVKPQAAYSHQALKDLIEDVTQSSMMRLDAKSMDKLWDLITMVFKWQITLSDDLLKLTQRHLYEIENYVTHETTQLQLHKVQNVFDNFAKALSPSEVAELRASALDWLKDFHVRVSLLLRIGLQDNKGRFVVENLCPFAEDMLRNLGENIYSVTQNGKLLRDGDDDDDRAPEEDDEPKDTNRNEALELEMLAGQLKGGGLAGGNATGGVLKLSINCKDNKSASHFDNIAARTDNTAGNNNNGADKLDGMFDDLQIAPGPNDNDFSDDLIDMIENGAN